MIAQIISHGSSRSEFRGAGLGRIARARRTIGTGLKYIDHPSFDDPNAREAILAPLNHAADDQVSQWPGPSDWLTPFPNGRSGPPFVSREQEAHLFRKMNYLKWRANRLREQLNPDWPDLADLDEIERLQCEALAVKNRIVEMNLRLVVSIAKTRVRADSELSECVSDGNLALIQAVDAFDFARGNRFSTYATWAIRNVLARNDQRFIRRRAHHFALYEEPVATPDSGIETYERQDFQDRRRAVMRRWLDRLDKRERRILTSRYGIGGTPELTLARIGLKLGISKERVRQIEARAHSKLRNFALAEGLETFEI